MDSGAMDSGAIVSGAIVSGAKVSGAKVSASIESLPFQLKTAGVGSMLPALSIALT
jgi:hypothetical protein